jgi:hypothetical protein
MAKFPAYLAGLRVTAALLASGQTDTYVKAGATVRPSTVAFTDDPDLQVPLAANGTFMVEFFVKYATTKAAGFQTKWNVPGTFTGPNRQVEGLGGASAAVAAQDNTPSATDFSVRFGVHAFTTAVQYGSRNSASNQVWLYEWATVVTGVTPGTVALQWCQLVSTIDNTQVTATSLARATQIG